MNKDNDLSETNKGTNKEFLGTLDGIFHGAINSL